MLKSVRVLIGIYSHFERKWWAQITLDFLQAIAEGRPVGRRWLLPWKTGRQQKRNIRTERLSAASDEDEAEPRDDFPVRLPFLSGIKGVVS